MTDERLCAPTWRTPLPVLPNLGRTGFSLSESPFRLKASRPLAALLALATLGACDAAPRSQESMTASTVADSSTILHVIDDAGRTLTLARPAARIISLLPAVTETLVAMGATDLLVGRTDYDIGIDHLPSVGGGLTPSLEMIASLRPDLVVAWEESAGARIRPRLEELGIAVFAAQTRDTADIFFNIDRLGQLTGRVESADSLADWIRSEFEAVRASVAGRSSPRVLYLVGLDPPIVAGPNLFIGEVLEVAGGNNVFADVKDASPQMSLEEIVRRRPEVVLLPASGTAAASIDRLVASPGWSELYRSGGTRFEAMPPDVLHRPGPSIVDGAWLLRDAIHPDLAWRR